MVEPQSAATVTVPYHNPPLFPNRTPPPPKKEAALSFFPACLLRCVMRHGTCTKRFVNHCRENWYMGSTMERSEMQK